MVYSYTIRLTNKLNYFQIDYYFTASDKANNTPCYKCKEGKVWRDSWGYTCLAYYYGNFCTTNGTTGWDVDSYGQISEYMNAGKDAFEACGACGKT